MKNQIENLLKSAVEAVRNEGRYTLPSNFSIQIERTKDERHGHFASNVALMLSKQAGVAPRELAAVILSHIPNATILEKTEIAGPGFINFYLAQNALYRVIEDVLLAAEKFGHTHTGKGQRILIEFVSANPTGPLHVGHGRSAAYGACVSNLLEATGYQVQREYYVNDAGRQMRILGFSTWLRYLEILGESVTLPAKAYQGDYVIEIARELVDRHGEQFKQLITPVISDISAKNQTMDEKRRDDIIIDECVTTMHELLGTDGFEIFRSAALEAILADIKEDLEEFGVHYNNWFRESSLLKEGLLEKGINLLKSHGHTFEQDGALWFRATDFGDEKDRVLLRANGQPTYFAADVAYHLHKYESKYDQIIDVFGADHHGYVPRIRAFLEGLGKDPKKLHVLLVQFAILYRGDERVQMSTRSGQFVTLRELRDEVGKDAARYFYIMRKPEQHLDFDLELAKSQSQENPVYYIQYAHARICRVWEQLEKQGFNWNKEQGVKHLSLLTQEHELALLNALSQYPEVLASAANNHEPHSLANFLQNFANVFHSYYNSSRFIIDDEKQRDARLCLMAAIQQVLKNGLSLLGLSAPTSM